MQIASLTLQRSAIDVIVMLTATSEPMVCWVEGCHIFHGVVGLLKSTSGNDAHEQTFARIAKKVQAVTLTRIQHVMEKKSRKQTLYSSSHHISNRKPVIPRPTIQNPSRTFLRKISACYVNQSIITGLRHPMCVLAM